MIAPHTKAWFNSKDCSDLRNPTRLPHFDIDRPLAKRCYIPGTVTPLAVTKPCYRARSLSSQALVEASVQAELVHGPLSRSRVRRSLHIGCNAWARRLSVTRPYWSDDFRCSFISPPRQLLAFETISIRSAAMLDSGYV